jgi:hypothetical protein
MLAKLAWAVADCRTDCRALAARYLAASLLLFRASAAAVAMVGAVVWRLTAPVAVGVRLAAAAVLMVGREWWVGVAAAMLVVARRERRGVAAAMLVVWAVVGWERGREGRVAASAMLVVVRREGRVRVAASAMGPIVGVVVRAAARARRRVWVAVRRRRVRVPVRRWVWVAVRRRRVWVAVRRWVWVPVRVARHRKPILAAALLLIGV